MIQTGKTPVTVMTLIAVFSISLVVNLPGLAISPMLERLKTIFPDTTQLETQLLTTLPNVLIIPFILLSGKFSESPHKIRIVLLGLLLFTACAVAYLFAQSMAALIVISCLLGAGAGILIPFSTGLLADIFSGSYKMKEMGIQSAVGNITLVIVTYVVGWMQTGNWHLPFTVYLIILVPLLLTPFLRGIPKTAVNTNDKAAQAMAEKNRAIDMAEIKNELAQHPTRFSKSGISYARLCGVFMVYFLTTYFTIVIPYYSPFLVQTHGWSESFTGAITSIYFFFIFLAGVILTPAVRLFKGYTSVACAAFIPAGLALIYFVPQQWAFCLGAVFAGFGYGLIQPLLYDKSTRCVNDPNKATLAMSIVLAANYVAVVLAPFFCDAVRDALHMPADGHFPFLLNTILGLVFLLVVFLRRKHFTLYIHTAYFFKSSSKATLKTENTPT